MRRRLAAAALVLAMLALSQACQEDDAPTASAPSGAASSATAGAKPLARPHPRPGAGATGGANKYTALRRKPPAERLRIMAEEPFSEKAIALRRDFCGKKWVLFVDERLNRKLGLEPLLMRTNIDLEVVKVLFGRAKSKHVPRDQMKSISDDLTKYGRGPSLPTERVDTALRQAGCRVTRRLDREPTKQDRERFDLVVWSKRTDRAKGSQLVLSYSTEIGTKGKLRAASVKHEWAFDRSKGDSKARVREGAEAAVAAELANAKKVLRATDALIAVVVESSPAASGSHH